MKLNNKNLLTNIILSTVVLLSIKSAGFAIPPVNTDADKVNVSIEEKDFKNDEKSLIEKFSLRNKFKRSPKAQVESFIKKYNKYSESNKIEKLQDLYSDSYVNNDGFNKKTIFELMKEASDLYKNVKYTSEIKEIKVNGDNAAVSIYETAIGETLKSIEKFEGNGIIESEMNYINYLRKENGEWKLLATDVRDENVSIKYGEAKNMEVEVIAPQYVPSDCDYEVSVKMKSGLTRIPVEEEDGIELESVSPDGLFIVGSITNDKIKFPQEPSKEVLRAVKSEELARILKSNKDGYNEYATISLGITRAHIEPPSVVIKMTGMEIIMSRVNILPVKFEQLSEKELNNGEKK